MSSSGNMDEDLQSYLSAHRDSHSGDGEIDWTKLMESGDMDRDLDLMNDKPLYTTYNDSEESDVDLFLKTPVKSQHQSQTDSKKKRRLSARQTSLEADPNLHVVSELNLPSDSTNITLTSTTDDSVSVSVAAHRPHPDTHTEREKRPELEERSSLDSTALVRNISDLSLSDQTLSGRGKFSKGGGAALQIVPPRTLVSKNDKSLSDEDESSLLSDAFSNGSGKMTVGWNVFSIDQLEDHREPSKQVETTPTQPGRRDQATPTGNEVSEDTSLSEHLDRGYTVNIHTVDELLVDGLEAGHEESKNKTKVSDKTESTETNPSHTKTGALDPVTIHSDRDTSYKKAADIHTNLRTGSFKFSASSQSNSEQSLTADNEDRSYSVDEDFESVTVSTSSREHLSSHGGVCGAGSGVGSDGGGEDVASHFGEDEGTEYQYSSFSEEEEVTADHTTASCSHSSINPRRSKTKQHSTTRKHSSKHSTKQSNQQDAFVQTPSYLYPGPAPGHTPSLSYSGPPPPTPILPFVFSAEKLEVLSTYSPHSVALNDMIKSQLALIRHSMETTRHQVTTIHNTLNSDHHYTSLEETKDYIKRNRPRTLTMKEAKKRYKGTRNL